MSGKFENTAIDTQREYFNAAYFNTTGIPQNAKYEITLLKPFFNDPDKWKLAINRFRVPLSTVPLTEHNIPFEQWQVGLGYHNSTQGDIELAYVPQLNPKTKTIYDYFNLAGDFNSQDVYLQPNFEVIDQSLISGVSYDILPAYESSNSINTFYILNTDNFTVSAYQNNSNTLTWDFAYQPLQITETFYNMQFIYADINGNFYYCYYTKATSVIPVYTLYIQEFTRATATTWTAGTLYELDFYEGQGLVNTFLVYDGKILLYITYPPESTHNPGTYYIYWTLGGPGYTNSGQVGTNKWVSAADATWIYRTDSSGTFTVSNDVILNYTHTGIYSDRFLGFDQAGNLLMHSLTSTGADNGYLALNAISGVVAYTFIPNAGSYGILYNTSAVVPSDAGNYPINTLQTFLNQINLAFETTFLAIQTTVGLTYQPTQAPRVIYDSITKLFSIIAEGFYTQLDSTGVPLFQIFLNIGLWNQFFFPSTDLPYNNTILKQLIVQNNGINAVPGTGAGSLPQFVYIQQESSTLYNFNDLTRVIVGTLSIPVSGDGEGVLFTNTGATSNKTINMITDILPDTTQQLNNDPVIYIPQGILRWYNLYAQQPFSKIDLIFYYETKDGVIHPLTIANGEYFSCKLEFKKGTQGEDF